MRTLLDTHALLWWLAGSDRLSAVARRAIADESHEVLVSAASAWEIATKYRLGRLPGAAAVAEDLGRYLLDQGFRGLAITVADGERAGRLPGPVRDPFDRMLIAQALARDIALVSVEKPFDGDGAAVALSSATGCASMRWTPPVGVVLYGAVRSRR